jgi:hypothetical protein
MPQTQMGVVRWVTSPGRIVARILPADDEELNNPAWTKFLIPPDNPALELVKVARPAITLVGQTRIFLYGISLTTGGPALGCTFPDPGNWNKGANRIEAIGAGQPGWSGFSESGGGGGGGAYGFGVNVPTTLPTGYTVWPTQGAPYAGLVTIWGSFAYSGAGPGIQGPGVVYAELAYGGQNSAPGVGGSQVYPTGFSGGNGGSGIIGPLNTPGGGGGGAAGPGGAGGNGGAATTTQFGAGGTANNNAVAGGFPASGNGHTGTEWGSIAGCGSGGAGSISATSNGCGGAFYGGGGGGGARGVGPETTATPIGGGGDGLIVITYVPLPQMQAQMQA